MLAVVVAVGARTSVGLTARHTAFLLRAGAVGFHEAPLLDVNDEPVTIGCVPTLPPSTVGVERVGSLALAALDEALAALEGDTTALRARIVVGLDVQLGRHAPGARSDADDVGRVLRDRCAPRFASTAVDTHARDGAAVALELQGACDELASGRVDVVVLCGAHSDYDPVVVRGLSHHGRLFGAGRVNGVIPGESAGVIVLMSPPMARRLGMMERARLHAIGAGFETARPDNDEPSFAALGLTMAVRTAAAVLDESGLRAGWALTDMTAEVHRVNEFQAMFVRTQRSWCQPQCIESHAHKLGRLGAAALPVQIAIAATAWRHGFAPHAVAIAMVGSESGERAATVWSAPPARS